MRMFAVSIALLWPGLAPGAHAELHKIQMTI